MSNDHAKHILPWFIRPFGFDDLDAIVTIEQLNFFDPWTRSEFLWTSNQINQHIRVAYEPSGKIAGYMVCEIKRHSYIVHSVSVCPSRQRWGVGSSLLRQLIDTHSNQTRRRITAKVREGNLAGQLFFRSHGFKCVNVLRGVYEGCSESAYVMSYRPKVTAAADETCQGR